MTNESKPRTLFAGIGSPHGDDRIGWLVADALDESMLPGVEVRQASTPSHVLDWLDGFDRLVICDACLRTGGTDLPYLHRWTWPTLEVSSLRSANSHAFGLAQVLQLAERLGTLPQEVIVFGVEGERFDAFAELSSRMSEAFDSIIKVIAVELDGACSRAARGSKHTGAARHA